MSWDGQELRIKLDVLAKSYGILFLELAEIEEHVAGGPTLVLYFRKPADGR